MRYKKLLLSSFVLGAIACGRVQFNGLKTSSIALKTESKMEKHSDAVPEVTKPAAVESPLPSAPSDASITLSGAPKSVSNLRNVELSVQGKLVSMYVYAIGKEESDCTLWSAPQPLDAALKVDLSKFSDGPVFVCAKGLDPEGKQVAYTTETWLFDGSAPSIRLSGYPQGMSSASEVNIKVTSDDAVTYKFHVGYSQQDCEQDKTKYTQHNIVQLIALKDLKDGDITICVLVADALGNETLPKDAEKVTWTKDSSPKTAELKNVPTPLNRESKIQISVAGKRLKSYRFVFLSDESLSKKLTCPTTLSSYEKSAEISVAFEKTLDKDADYLLCVLGVDDLGNTQSPLTPTIATWRRDTVVPKISFSQTPLVNTVTLNTKISATDVGSPIKSVSYVLKYDSPCPQTPAGTKVLAATLTAKDSIGKEYRDGVMRICAWSEDAAGNTASSNFMWTKKTWCEGHPHLFVDKRPGYRKGSAAINETCKQLLGDQTRVCNAGSWSNWDPGEFPSLECREPYGPGKIVGGGRERGNYYDLNGSSDECKFTYDRYGKDLACDTWGVVDIDNNGNASCPSGTTRFITSGIQSDYNNPMYFICVKNDETRPLSDLNEPSQMYPGEICGGKQIGGSLWGCAAKYNGCPGSTNRIRTQDNDASYLCVIGSSSQMAAVNYSGGICGGGGGQGNDSYGCSNGGSCPSNTKRARVSDSSTYFLCVVQ